MAAFDMIGIRADPDDADDGQDLDVRVLLIDPSPLSRSCLLAGFRESPGISIVACGHVEEFVETAFAKPHVIAIQAAGHDLESQEFGERMDALTRRFPGVAVMLLSGAGDDDQIMAGIRHGVSAYITSDIGLRPTVRAIRLMRQGLMIYPHHMLQTLGKHGAAPFKSASHSGEAAAAASLDDGMLTPRQQDVLLLLARGLSNKAIASQLDISESTVKVHIRAIMERTGMMNRTQIVAHFFRDRH